MTTEIAVDDLTGQEIPEEIGWELRGRVTGRTFHFRSITDLLEFFITGKWSGVSEDHFRRTLDQRGVTL